MIIYKITNLVNGKIYIGQTTNTLEYRFDQHLREARYSQNNNTRNNYFHNALNYYGKDNFKAEIIDTAETLEELNKKEIYWINYYNSINKSIGYNLQEGGKSGKRTDSTKKKIGALTKKNWENPEFAKKCRIGLKKATEKWQQICKENRIELECQYCHKKFSVAPSASKTRKYCSQECANLANSSRLIENSKKSAELKRQKTAERNILIQQDVLQWLKENKELVNKCPKNSISTNLISLQQLIINKYNFSDWRSISTAICGSPSKIKLLEYLKEKCENIC